MGFKKGDKIIADEEGWDITRGSIYTQLENSDFPIFRDNKGARRERHPNDYHLWSPATSGERDPNGVDAHSPGAKLDAGKVRPSLVIEGMARALWGVAEVATFGAAKYTPGGWVLVPNGQERYADAGYRHTLRRAMGEENDPDSTLAHLKHEAWNALAKLDLHLREQEEVKIE